MPVEDEDDVGRAADEAEVDADAAAEPHPAVARRCHQHDAAGRAVRVEALRRTVVCRTTTMRVREADQMLK